MSADRDTGASLPRELPVCAETVDGLVEHRVEPGPERHGGAAGERWKTTRGVVDVDVRVVLAVAVVEEAIALDAEQQVGALAGAPLDLRPREDVVRVGVEVLPHAGGIETVESVVRIVARAPVDRVTLVAHHVLLTEAAGIRDRRSPQQRGDAPGLVHRLREVGDPPHPAVPGLEVPVLLVELRGDLVAAVVADGFELAPQVAAVAAIAGVEARELSASAAGAIPGGVGARRPVVARVQVAVGLEGAVAEDSRHLGGGAEAREQVVGERAGVAGAKLGVPGRASPGLSAGR